MIKRMLGCFVGMVWLLPEKSCTRFLQTISLNATRLSGGRQEKFAGRNTTKIRIKPIRDPISEGQLSQIRAKTFGSASGLAAAIWVAAQRLARPDLNAATPHVGLEPKLSIAAHGLKGREPCNAAIGPGKIGLLRSLVGGLRAAARRHQARLSPHVIWQRSGGGPQCGPSRVCQTRNRVLAPNGPGTSTS